LKVSEAGIGNLRVAITGGDGFKVTRGLLESGRDRFPVKAGILGEIDLSVIAGCVYPDRSAGPRRADCSEAGCDAAQLVDAAIRGDAIRCGAGDGDQAVILRGEKQDVLGQRGEAAPGGAAVGRGNDNSGLAFLLKGKIRSLGTSVAIWPAVP